HCRVLSFPTRRSSDLVKLVQQANVPSLQRLNPEVDAELEAVIMKALTRDPRERYQSAREFGDALAGYLFGKQLKVTSYDIANLVKEVVERKSKAAKPQEASIIDRLIQEELLRFTSLDDMSGSDPLNLGQTPLSPEDVAGAQPLDPHGFENPADWFADDAEVADAVAGAAGKSRSGPGWRESGLEADVPSDLANLLESDVVATPPARSSRPTPEPPPRTSAPEAHPYRQSSAPGEVPAPEPKGGAMKWVMLGVLL